MKTYILQLLSVGMILVTGMTYGDYVVPFDEPPFTIGETIIGIEEWQPRLASASLEETEESARLVKVRWDDDKPAALLNGASIKTKFPKTENLKVEITVRLALTHTHRGTNLQQLRLLLGVPCGEIVFLSNKDEGGFGFGSGNPRDMKVLVPYEDIKSNSYYTIKLTVDYVQMQYDILIQGEKPDGSPLNFEETGVVFEEVEAKKTSLDNLAIISSKDVRVYLKELSIKSL